MRLECLLGQVTLNISLRSFDLFYYIVETQNSSELSDDINLHVENNPDKSNGKGRNNWQFW